MNLRGNQNVPFLNITVKGIDSVLKFGIPRVDLLAKVLGILSCLAFLFNQLKDISDHLSFCPDSFEMVICGCRVKDSFLQRRVIISKVLIEPDMQVSLIIKPKHVLIDFKSPYFFKKRTVTVQGFPQSIQNLREGQLWQLAPSLDNPLRDNLHRIVNSTEASASRFHRFSPVAFHQWGINSPSIIVDLQFFLRGLRGIQLDDVHLAFSSFGVDCDFSEAFRSDNVPLLGIDFVEPGDHLGSAFDSAHRNFIFTNMKQILYLPSDRNLVQYFVSQLQMIDAVYIGFFWVLVVEILIFVFLNLPTPKGFKGKLLNLLSHSKIISWLMWVHLIFCLLALFFYVDLSQSETFFNNEKEKLRTDVNRHIGTQLRIGFLSYTVLKIQRNKYITFMLIYTSIALNVFIQLLKFTYRRREKLEAMGLLPKLDKKNSDKLAPKEVHDPRSSVEQKKDS